MSFICKYPIDLIAGLVRIQKLDETVNLAMKISNFQSRRTSIIILPREIKEIIKIVLESDVEGSVQSDRLKPPLEPLVTLLELVKNAPQILDFGIYSHFKLILLARRSKFKGKLF